MHSSYLSQELRFRRARTGHKNPPRPEIRKNHEKKYKIPHPGLGPENTRKLPKKYKNSSKMTPFCIFSVIFSYFRGPSLQGGGFCIFFVIFSYFRPWGVFVPCTSPTESQHKRTSCEERELCVSNSKSMVLRISHVCMCVLNS